MSGPIGPSTTVAPTSEELDWCARHWPLDDLPVGSRVEIGLARDLAWGDLLSRIRRGTAVAIDYGHTAAARPTDGTLAAYHLGDLVAAVPDGTCDLTAHVAVDSLTADDVLPPIALAGADAPAYLAAVARASSEGALTRLDGLGGFWWILRRTSM